MEPGSPFWIRAARVRETIFFAVDRSVLWRPYLPVPARSPNFPFFLTLLSMLLLDFFQRQHTRLFPVQQGFFADPRDEGTRLASSEPTVALRPMTGSSSHGQRAHPEPRRMSARAMAFTGAAHALSLPQTPWELDKPSDGSNCGSRPFRLITLARNSNYQTRHARPPRTFRPDSARSCPDIR